MQPALAEPETTTSLDLDTEKYHVFIPYVRSRTGGKQEITLRSGEKLELNIPARTTENTNIRFQLPGRRGEAIAIAHTLYDRTLRLADQIYQEIDNTSFIQDASKTKCKLVYEQVEDARYINDLTSLQLLDYVVETSRLDDSVKDRYLLASTNSRLLGIQNVVESTLATSRLSQDKRQLILGTFELVRAGEPITDFKALSDLDSIVTASQLPPEIQNEYTIASAKSRAITVDLILVKWLDENPKFDENQKIAYLMAYQEVRDGRELSNEDLVNDLDDLILTSKISDNAKLIYAITRQNNRTEGQDLGEQVMAFIQDYQDVENLKKSAKKVYGKGASVVPQATRLLSAAGAETATGVSLSSLSGAAATNATLAALGGGSVAAGGLGMLGGLVVATGGAALIGAAGLLSIALISEMDGEDFRNLGISVGTGTVAGAATVLAAWTAASTLGVTGTLSGAAAISATISALGGLSIMTGGAALVASGTAFLVWSFMKGRKKRDQGILRQVETRIYTPTEEPKPNSLESFLADNILDQYGKEEGFTSPNIPLDKLSTALSKWITLEPNERVLALIDSSFWDDAKEGVVLTDRKIRWKAFGSNPDSISYDRLFSLMDSDLSNLLINEERRDDLGRVEELTNIFSEDNDEDRWVQVLTSLKQQYTSFSV
ncbi:hypothetical protein E1H12_03160 [Geitlerinema sp. P-1104]|uniref:hypothetical protein n=1 Tax=Geitlerinema sp. P-1104 TaxID=2546230 RepID=UPI00147705BF|nr:hypothetical protein [Geitlerinema sp. P-1104]NMG57546.1 hypothetical protein [Geitlerinema sp. P-1104]